MEHDDLLSQQEVWNDRAEHWSEWGFGEPLAPSSEELVFQQRQIVGGKTLVLGATKSLCEVAASQSKTVVAVDFSAAAIDVFQTDDVQYICQDWITFLEESTAQFDTIVTDNGLVCLEFPREWQRIAAALRARLVPGGVFSSRFFLSTETTPKERYDNHNLTRIMPAIGRASLATHWMTVKPGAVNGERFAARYTFPTIEVVKNVFRDYSIIDELIPAYEEGEHFVSIAFQRPNSQGEVL